METYSLALTMIVIVLILYIIRMEIIAARLNRMADRTDRNFFTVMMILRGLGVNIDAGSEAEMKAKRNKEVTNGTNK